MPERDLVAGAGAVTHALRMVCELPPYTDDRSLPPAVSTACLEAWYVNARLLVDFFTGPRQMRDMHPLDFLPEWEPAGVAEALKKRWDDASKLVVHLSWRRVPEADELIPNVAPDMLAALASLLCDAAEEFSGALRDVDSPVAAMFENDLQSARASLP